MNEYTDQISGYFNQVPMWPLVLLAVAIVISGIYELVHRKHRANAIDDFRSAILSTLSGLYPEPTNWPKSIDTYLCARLPVMQEIIDDFKPNVRQENLPAYNRDWDNYYQFCRTEVTDDKCMAAELNPGTEPDPKKQFHTLVSNLLRHAS
ncbi:hypothetical protein [Nitrosospira sp. Nsp13]|uniref:hypothetical protein n=1 Tax=Nitrosospira sp. Nsp13 TaxID=1855332 RepID=UPI00088B868E|nr:hypothetical protein [Nitrosospira sp. Nsp13]SCY26651.1 hypothetical protein SAMN05216308_106145 [Nitrosospira sp. Nsp13]